VATKPLRRNRSVLIHAIGLAVAYVLMFVFTSSAYAQSVTLAWDSVSATNLSGYRVYRSEQSGAFTGSPINGSSALTTTAFTDSTAQSGRTYYYVVTAVNTSGVQSPYSNEVQVAIPAAASPTTPPSPPSNTAPQVTAGPDQTITLPSTATLTATAVDDGLPNGTLTYAWSVVSGSGVTLSSPDSATTSASFVAGGPYTIRVTVSDGQLSSSVDVKIVVNTETLTLLVSKSGNVIRGSMTSISESTADLRARKLNLYIDDQLASSVQGSSLTYRWDLRRISGRHVITGMSFDASDTVLVSKSITVNVK